MKRATSLAECFRERRAEFSTRIGARGDGFEFGEWGAINPDFRAQVSEMCRVLKLAEAAASEGDEAAFRQVNQLRGKLGNFRRMIREPQAFALPDFFMTVAREVLPQWVFDAVMTDARWMRELEATEVAAQIDAAIGAPRGSPSAVSMRTRQRSKRRRNSYG